MATLCLWDRCFSVFFRLQHSLLRLCGLWAVRFWVRLGLFDHSPLLQARAVSVPAKGAGRTETSHHFYTFGQGCFRSRVGKNAGALRLPCMLVEAESTVNYGIFDLMLYCLSTWVHTSNLVLLPQLAQLLFQVYIYREMISPNEAMHVPDELVVQCT